MEYAHESVLGYAKAILEAETMDEKVRLTDEAIVRWRSKEITSRGDDAALTPPDHPARPAELNVVPPTKTRSKGNKHMLHALANIEVRPLSPLLHHHHPSLPHPSSPITD